MNSTILINKLREYLEKQPNIIFAYLFGSYARGDYHTTSDIDIAIYTKDKDLGLEHYKSLRQELMDLMQKNVDLVLLNDATPLVKHLIIKEKVHIFSKAKDEERDFIVKSLYEYNDMKPYLDLAYNTMIKRIRREVEDGCWRGN